MKTPEVLLIVRALETARRYYYAGRPIMTDELYDKLEDRLRTLTAEHPLLGEIGPPSEEE